MLLFRCLSPYLCSMSRTQRFRRLFLLCLILWGIAGGLVSLHTCLDSTENKVADSCCCESSPSSQVESKSADCCKTLTSYVGIPLYFINAKQNFSFSDCFQFEFSVLETQFNSEIVSFNNTIYPPPDIPIIQGQFKRMLAMRI